MRLILFFILWVAVMPTQGSCKISDTELERIETYVRELMNWQNLSDEIVLTYEKGIDRVVIFAENVKLSKQMEKLKARGGNNMIKLVYDMASEEVIEYYLYQ